MLKLLIVDDEEMIRTGLMKLFDWNSLGFEIVGEAADGNKALDLVKEKKPDIVLTDIRMPFKDGLELINDIKLINDDIRCVILTGYDEFKYAKRAIELGAYSYILKPIEPEVLIEVLNKISLEITRKSKEKDRINDLIQEVEQNRRMEKEYFIIKIVIGAYEPNIDVNVVEKLGFDKHIYSIAIIEEESDNDSYLSTLIELTLSSKNETGRIGWIKYSKNTVLLWAWGENEHEVEGILKSFAEALKQEQKKVNLSNLTIGLGTPHKGITGISLSFNEAVEALNYKFVAGNNIILEAKTVRQERNQHNLATKGILDVADGVRTGNKKIIEDGIEKIYRNAVSMGVRAKPYIHMAVTDAYMQALKIVSDVGGNIGEIFDDPVATFDEIISSPTLEKCLSELTYAIGEIQEYILLKKNGKYASIIEKAENYIKDNFHNVSLSLDKIAHFVGMSSCYFSTIFKQEKGISFIDFLMGIRIQKAKELLSNPKYMAYEVCEMVGYENYSHFSTLFKKNTGMSPTEYKKGISE